MTDFPFGRSVFDLQRIRENTMVHQIDFHWEIDSTNLRAVQQSEAVDTPTPLLVLAEQQTAGRGRGSNRWWSSDGSLTFSLLVDRNELPADQTSLLALTAGLAVCQAVERFAPLSDIGLKWPNDIYLDGRKLAGILIELPANRTSRVVIGVGINVNNSHHDAPAEIRQTVISLRDGLQQELDRNEVLIGCLQELERRLEDLSADRADLADQWQAYNLLQDRQVKLEVGSRRVDGTCLGIDTQAHCNCKPPTECNDSWEVRSESFFDGWFHATAARAR